MNALPTDEGVTLGKDEPAMTEALRWTRYGSWLVFVCTAVILFTSPFSGEFRFDDSVLLGLICLSVAALAIGGISHFVLWKKLSAKQREMLRRGVRRRSTVD